MTAREWALGELHRIANEEEDGGWPRFEYADNYRLASVDDAAAVAEYEAARDEGCCGSYDTVIEHPIHGKWYIGFNYGH